MKPAVTQHVFPWKFNLHQDPSEQFALSSAHNSNQFYWLLLKEEGNKRRLLLKRLVATWSRATTRQPLFKHFLMSCKWVWQFAGGIALQTRLSNCYRSLDPVEPPSQCWWCFCILCLCYFNLIFFFSSLEFVHKILTERCVKMVWVGSTMHGRPVCGILLNIRAR